MIKILIFLGEGTFTWKDGTKYEGQYFDDKKEGRGKFYWYDNPLNFILISFRPTGQVYDGEWKNGKQHGKGKFIDTDGVERTGVWENGNNIKLE